MPSPPASYLWHPEENGIHPLALPISPRAVYACLPQSPGRLPLGSCRSRTPFFPCCPPLPGHPSGRSLKAPPEHTCLLCSGLSLPRALVSDSSGALWLYWTPPLREEQGEARRPRWGPKAQGFPQGAGAAACRSAWGSGCCSSWYPFKDTRLESLQACSTSAARGHLCCPQSVALSFFLPHSGFHRAVCRAVCSELGNAMTCYGSWCLRGWG